MSANLLMSSHTGLLPVSRTLSLGVLMEVEVSDGKKEDSRQFKLEAVDSVSERGVSIVQAARDLDLNHNMLRPWLKELDVDSKHAFPGLGQMRPEQLEIDQLRKEVARLKAKRDILQNAAAYFARDAI